MSIDKRIDIESDKDFYNFLSNLGDKKNSIIVAALQAEGQRLNESKDHVLENMDSIDKDLAFYKKNFVVFERESQHAIDFLFSFDNDYGLQEYFALIGIEPDFLSGVRKIITEEANTGKKFKEIKKQISDLLDSKDKCKKEIEELDIQIKDNKKRLDLSSSYASDLGALIEGSINDNGTFNKDYVKGLLVPIEEAANKYDFDLGNNFIDRASKAIFFPKDGLEEEFKKYSNGGESKYSDIVLEDNNKKDISIEKEADEEAITEVEEEPTFVEDVQISEEEKAEEARNIASIDEAFEQPVEEEITEETEEPVAEPQEDIDISLPDDFNKEPGEMITEPEEFIEASEEVEEEEPVIEEEQVFETEPDIVDLLTPETHNADVDSIIENCNLNASMVSEGLSELLRYANEGEVRNNYDTLRAINLDEDNIYYESNGYAYLTDSELVDKINFLRGKGIGDKVIVTALNNHYLNNGLEKMKHNVQVLEDSNIPFNKEFLVVMDYDLSNYVKAIASLADYGIEPDDVEKTQYLALLTKFSNNIVPDTEILKDYGISLLRKNGKYALEIYAVEPEVLQQSIDQILETGEVGLVETVPEVLALNADTIVERINYLKDSNEDYKNGNVYSDVVYKPMAFHLQFGDNVVRRLIDLKDSNNQLSEEIGNDYCSVLIEILNKYYNDPSCYMSLELDQEEQVLVDELNSKFAEEFGAELISRSLYRMDNNYISKNKFERNLNYLVSVLLKNGQEVKGNYSEILLVSAYYNKRVEYGKNFDLPKFMK